jgi:hypothetical protein
MMYYDYFLNIDVSVYEQIPKHKSQLEVLAVRIDVMKRIISILNVEKANFAAIEPKIADIMDK